MAHLYRWNVGSGTFDTPGSWLDVTFTTPSATQLIPGTADSALLDMAGGTIAGVGAIVGTLDVSGTETVTGLIQFGNLAAGFAGQPSLFPVGGNTTLTVAAGATLEQVGSLDTAAGSFPVYIGADGTAEVDLAGAGSALLTTGAVGVAGGSKITVAAGSTLSAGVLDLFGSGTIGSVAVVSGAGATLDASSWLAVGEAGSGTLFLQGGAVADVGLLTVAYLGTTLNPSTSVLQITSAGSLIDTGYTEIGAGTHDTGTVILSGTGSALTTHGLYVGYGGKGTISIQAGATLTTLPFVGNTTSWGGASSAQTTGSSLMIVTGAGSEWSSQSRFDIGSSAAATLEILTGGALLATLNAVPIIQGGQTVALDANVSFDRGSGIVQGTAATIDAGGGPLWVGNLGTASLSISGGGSVTAGSSLPGFAAVSIGLDGGTGLVIVSGAGSRFTAVGQMEVGGLSAGSNTSELLVENTASVFTGNSSLDSRAGLVVASGPGGVGYATIEGAGSVLTNSGRLDVGLSGTGSLLVQAGGVLTTTLVGASQTLLAAGVIVGVNAGSSGLIEITGSGSRLTAGQSMVVGFESNGTLDVLAGGSLSVATTFGVGNTNQSVGTGTGHGVAVVDGIGSTLSVGGSVTVGGKQSGYTGTGTLSATNSGYFDALGPAVLLAGSTLSADGTGTFEIGGHGHGARGQIVIDAGSSLTGAGVVSGAVDNFGAIDATGGTLKFTSNMQGGGTIGIAAGATLELGGVVFNTAQFQGQGTLLLDQGSAFLGTLQVATSGGTVDIASEVVTSATITGGSLVTTLAGGGVMSLKVSGAVSGLKVSTITDGHGGTDVVIPCFAAGTRIRTTRGEVPVEALAAGDRVATASGGTRPVRWVGRRTLDCARHPRPWDVRPVRVRAGAFAPGRPARDLLLSPDHALLIGGVLIPVRYLINGATIAQEHAREVTYCHVELDAHDVLLAEGLPAESFLDTGNRAAFANGSDAVMLHPEFAGARTAAAGCAKLVLAGPKVAAARRKLLRRAEALGHALSSDPMLSVLGDGRMLPALVSGPHWRVPLPAGTRVLRLVSRVWVPADTEGAGADTRRLGVPLDRLWLDGREAARDSAALATGWYPAEARLRWTDGDATLLVEGVRELAFTLAATGQYRVTADGAGQATRLARGSGT